MPRPTTPPARVRLEHLAVGMVYKDPHGRPRWVTVHQVDEPVPHDSESNTRQAVISPVNGKNAGRRVNVLLYDQLRNGHYVVQAGSVPDGYAIYPDGGGLTEPIRTPVDQLRKLFPEIFARGEKLGSSQDYMEYMARLAEHDGAPAEVTDCSTWTMLYVEEQAEAEQAARSGTAWLYPQDRGAGQPPQRVWRLADTVMPTDGAS